MNLAIAIVVLGAQSVLAVSNQSVQIGAAAPVRSTDAYHPPLDNRLSIHLRDGSLEDFFVEVSRQTKLKFFLVQGVEECRIGAFLNDLSAREALQTVLEAGNISFQQIGRSDTYTITRRHREKLSCPTKPKAIAAGQCSAGSPPISIECKDGKLSEFAEHLHNQSGANLAVWNEALEFPLNINLSNVSLGKALKKIRKNSALDVRQLDTKNIFTFALKTTAESIDQSSVQPSTRVISITPTGVQEYVAPEKRKEPEPNQTYKPETPN
jgi:hypothetical protein